MSSSVYRYDRDPRGGRRVMQWVIFQPVGLTVRSHNYPFQESRVNLSVVFAQG